MFCSSHKTVRSSTSFVSHEFDVAVACPAFEATLTGRTWSADRDTGHSHQLGMELRLHVQHLRGRERAVNTVEDTTEAHGLTPRGMHELIRQGDGTNVSCTDDVVHK